MNNGAAAEKYIQNGLLYIEEENRRSTFTKWVFSDKKTCNADKMAEAGFVFVGDKNYPDAVKCFLCDKSLDGWEATDNPWKEHLSHSTKCSFAKLQAPQGSMTLSQYLDLWKELAFKLIDNYYDEIKKNVEDELKKIELAACIKRKTGEL